MISLLFFSFLILWSPIKGTISPEKGDLVGEPLFLTPYINSGLIDEAKELSQVHNLSESVKSYSGLITVDEINGVHTFFWFFPSNEDWENAPLMLWSDGGPGVTGLFSIFNEHGPFIADSDGNLQLREKTWTQNHSIIYMDQPMDVGYSFTENEAGHVTNGQATAPNIYKFLIQFFKLFPELRENDFYNGGVSFGGIYAPSAAHYIHTKNNENPEFKINLKGLILETPLSDPISQVDYGDYLYHVGLIDEKDRVYFKSQSQRIKDLIAMGKYEEASQMNFDLLLGSQYGSYFTNVTAYTNTNNIMHENASSSFLNFATLAEKEYFRRALHVGNLTFNFVSPLVQKTFRPSFLTSVKPLIEDLLNAGYKCLIYGGNLDISTHHLGLNTMINSFNWNGAAEYANASRGIWRVDNSIAGYVKTARNFTYVLMRNAGHGAVGDQQGWGFDLFYRFTRDIPFSNSEASRKDEL